MSFVFFQPVVSPRTRRRKRRRRRRRRIEKSREEGGREGQEGRVGGRKKWGATRERINNAAREGRGGGSAELYVSKSGEPGHDPTTHPCPISGPHLNFNPACNCRLARLALSLRRSLPSFNFCFSCPPLPATMRSLDCPNFIEAREKDDRYGTSETLSSVERE